MKFKAYHKIRQFKDIIRDISFKSNYKGQDVAKEISHKARNYFFTKLDKID